MLRAGAFPVSGKRFSYLRFCAGNVFVVYERELFPLVLGEVSIILRDISDEFLQFRLWRVQPLGE